MKVIAIIKEEKVRRLKEKIRLQQEKLSKWEEELLVGKDLAKAPNQQEASKGLYEKKELISDAALHNAKINAGKYWGLAVLSLMTILLSVSTLSPWLSTLGFHWAVQLAILLILTIIPVWGHEQFLKNFRKMHQIEKAQGIHQAFGAVLQKKARKTRAINVAGNADKEVIGSLKNQDGL